MKRRWVALLLLGVVSSAGCSSADRANTAPDRSTTTTTIAKPKVADLTRQAAALVGRLHALIPQAGPASSAAFAAARGPLEQERLEIRRLMDGLAATKASAAAAKVRHALATDEQIVGTLLASSGDTTAIATAQGQLDQTEAEWRAALDAVKKETGATDLGV